MIKHHLYPSIYKGEQSLLYINICVHFKQTCWRQCFHQLWQLKLPTFFPGSKGWKTYFENNRDGNSLWLGNKNDRITYKGKSPGRVRVLFCGCTLKLITWYCWSKHLGVLRWIWQWSWTIYHSDCKLFHKKDLVFFFYCLNKKGKEIIRINI